jgi:hypothetical protein
MDIKGRPRKVRVKGVVVRVGQDTEGLRQLAIFFTEMSEDNKKLLNTYIQSKLKERQE